MDLPLFPLFLIRPLSFNVAILICVCLPWVQNLFDPNSPESWPLNLFHGEGRVLILQGGQGRIPSSHVDFPQVFLLLATPMPLRHLQRPHFLGLSGPWMGLLTQVQASVSSFFDLLVRCLLPVSLLFSFQAGVEILVFRHLFFSLSLWFLSLLDLHCYCHISAGRSRGKYVCSAFFVYPELLHLLFAVEAWPKTQLISLLCVLSRMAFTCALFPCWDAVVCKKQKAQLKWPKCEGNYLT